MEESPLIERSPKERNTGTYKSDDFEDVERDLSKNVVVNYVVNKGYYDAHEYYGGLVAEFNELCAREGIMCNELTEILAHLTTKVETYYENDKLKHLIM